MDWRVVVMSPADVTSGRSVRLQRGFERVFLALGGRGDVALFSRDVRGGGQEMYFSPASVGLCAAILVAYGGVPAAKPPKDGTALLVGDQRGADVLLS